MKFSISKSRLAGYLQQVLQVVPTKSTLPILSNVLIEALDNRLKISATDLDISITSTFECKVSRKGATALPARILFDIIKELPEADITIEAGANRIEIKIPNGSYKIAAISADDFPKLPAVNTKKEIRIAGGELVDMIRKTSFACSEDDTRPALNGVLWQTRGDRMQMVATDGHRLAKTAVDNSRMKGMYDDVIIPPKVLNLIPKFLHQEDQEIGIIFGENNIVFNLSDIILTSRLIEGPYPNFEQVIPEKNDKRLQISREDLYGAVRRVSILSNALTRQVKFSLANNTLTLSSANADVGGEGMEEIECDYQGEPIEMGYNANYIGNILEKIDSNEVVIELSSTVSAGVIYNPEVSKNDYLCLIMPLRLAE